MFRILPVLALITVVPLILLITLCMLGSFHAFIVVCILFLKSTFSKNSFWNTISMSNGLGPDQDRHSGSGTLGPNCLQSTVYQQTIKVATSKESVKHQQ